MPDVNETEKSNQPPKQQAKHILARISSQEKPTIQCLHEYVQQNAAYFRNFLDGYQRKDRNLAWDIVLDAIKQERGGNLPNKATVKTYLSAAAEIARSQEAAKAVSPPTPRKGGNKYAPKYD